MRIVGVALGVALLCVGGAVRQMDEDTYYVSGPAGPTAHSDLAAAAAQECADVHEVLYREASGGAGMTFRCSAMLPRRTQVAQGQHLSR